MPTLAGELRNKLERVVIDARDAAEAGARNALESLAVHHHEPYAHMKKEPELLELRNHLRARARQLGDRKLAKPDADGKDHEIDHLAGECAYEHWHRMLFARFLAENNLLMHPDGVAVIEWAERCPTIRPSPPGCEKRYRVRWAEIQVLSETERRIVYEDSGD